MQLVYRAVLQWRVTLFVCCFYHKGPALSNVLNQITVIIEYVNVTLTQKINLVLDKSKIYL